MTKLEREILFLLRINGPLFRLPIAMATGATWNAVGEALKSLQEKNKVGLCGKGRVKKWKVA